jgi:hypothetical protein
VCSSDLTNMKNIAWYFIVVPSGSRVSGHSRQSLLMRTPLC